MDYPIGLWNYGDVIPNVHIWNSFGWLLSCIFCGKVAFSCLLCDPINDTSKLFQVLTWCRQATNHYLIQSWPRHITSYALCTRPRYVLRLIIWDHCKIMFTSYTNIVPNHHEMRHEKQSFLYYLAQIYWLGFAVVLFDLWLINIRAYMSMKISIDMSVNFNTMKSERV